MLIPRSNWRSLAILLASLSALAPLSLDAVVPGLPATARAFGVSDPEAQLVLTSFMLGLAVSQLAWGPVGDRFGRKLPVMGGLLLFLGATALCLSTSSFSGLLAARCLQAVGAAGGLVLGRAIVRDLYSGEEGVALFSVITGALFLAPALGPVIGGYLAQFFGWKAMYRFLLAWGLLEAAAVWAALPETLPDRGNRAPPTPLGSARAVFASSRFRLCTAIASLASMGLFGFVAGSSQLLIGDLGLSAADFGYAYMVVATGYIVGTRLSGRLAGLPLRPRLVRGLFPGAAAGLALLLFSLLGPSTGSAALAMVVGCTWVFYVSLGLAQPVAMSGALQPFTHLSGAASAWMGFLQMGAGALATAVAGRLHSETEVGIAALFLLASLGGMAVAARLGDEAPGPSEGGL